MNYSSTTDSADMLVVMINWFIHFFNSPFIFVLKIIIAVYVIIIFIDIILLLVLRDVPAHLRTGMRGMDIPVISKSKMKKRWDPIKKRLLSEDMSQYKVAILEADSVVDEILAGIGYQGQDMSERFDQIAPAHLDSHHETLKDAHAIRNRIVHEENFSIDKQAAEDVLLVYENFLRYLEYLD